MDQRLSEISTVWSILHAAHGDDGERARKAQELILVRYGTAVRRYLLAAVQEAEIADELFQEFALRLVQGGLHRADPARGRFRDYVKVILFNLVARYRKGRQRLPQPMGNALGEGGEPAAASGEEEAFDLGWREQLLDGAWQELSRTQPLLHAVLRFRAEHPKMPSPEMAEALSRQLGKPFKPEAVRQNLRRARDLFADLLLAQVSHSLEAPTLEHIAQELAALGLLTYCQAALDRRTNPL